MKRKITLMARVKLSEGKYGFESVPTTDSKGRAIKPREPQDSTSFYLRYTDEVGKRHMDPVGDNFEDAIVKFLNAETRLEANKRGIPVVLPNDRSDRPTITEAVRNFIDEQKTLDKSEATIEGYTRAANQFQNICRKTYVDEIDRKDVLDYVAWIRNGGIPERKDKPNTQRNYTIRKMLQYLTVFFTANKMKNPLPKKEWPKVEEHDVEAFTTEEINQLLTGKMHDKVVGDAPTVDEKDLILFFLYTGFRDNEAAHTFYSDVDFDHGTINISNKPELGFTIKNRKQRKTDITLPANFLKRLKERRERHPEGDLIFPNSKDKPDEALLARVRTAAKRAGYKKNFGLHKFRKTFGTLYGERFGIVNAQGLLGHADIRTTQRYMAKTKIPAAAVEDLFSAVGD